MFAGPSRLSLNLRKTDTFDRYNMLLSVTDGNKPNAESDTAKHSFRFIFDTAGSFRSHRTALEIEASPQLDMASVDFQIPYKGLF